MQLRWLKRVATVKDDGTVQMEVPEGIQPESFHFETGVLDDEAVDDEPLDTANVSFIPPLQIVMLIVGTRGDVQPFVAIGKRLQVLFTFPVLFIISLLIFLLMIFLFIFFCIIFLLLV